MMMIKIKL